MVQVSLRDTGNDYAASPASELAGYRQSSLRDSQNPGAQEGLTSVSERTFYFAPKGLHRFLISTHGLRHGLYSFAASQLAQGEFF